VCRPLQLGQGALAWKGPPGSKTSQHQRGGRAYQFLVGKTRLRKWARAPLLCGGCPPATAYPPAALPARVSVRSQASAGADGQRPGHTVSQGHPPALSALSLCAGPFPRPRVQALKPGEAHGPLSPLL